MDFFVLQPSPEEKGIKTAAPGLPRRGRQLQPSPEEKGIKTSMLAHVTISPLQPSPEEKGIKTCPVCGLAPAGPLQPSPEEKGIKTYCIASSAHFRAAAEP